MWDANCLCCNDSKCLAQETDIHTVIQLMHDSLNDSVYSVLFPNPLLRCLPVLSFDGFLSFPCFPLGAECERIEWNTGTCSLSAMLKDKIKHYNMHGLL